MKQHVPRERGNTTHRPSDDDGMDSYVLRLPVQSMLTRLVGRNPLLRTADRVEALVSVLAVVVMLLAIPFAAAIGTEVYDSRRHAYAAEAPARHIVSATITDVPDSPASTITVQARWESAGAEHMGRVEAPRSVNIGDTIDIWVDDDGTPASAPTSTSYAVVDAVTAALVPWVGLAAASAGLFALTRAICHRISSTRWQQAIDVLVGDDEGRTIDNS